MAKDVKPSIKIISEKTGFSPATVSNALNHKRGVNKETAERIAQAAQELGYYANGKEIENIKFVVFRRTGDILDASSFHPAVIDGVEREAKKNELDTVFVRLNRFSSDYEEQVSRLVSDGNSAIILLGTEMTHEDFQDFANCQSPVIVLDGWDDNCNFSSVLINNIDSTRIAVEHLISKGHTSIGYIRGKMRIKAFEERQDGYITTLVRHGLEINKDYTITLSTKTETAYTDMLAWLDQHKDRKLPTAFFADNDRIALGAIRALSEKGYRIPEDVSIVGFDDIDVAAVASPPLSTVHVYKREMGREAVKRILNLMESSDGTRFKIESCTTFIERGSVKDIR